MSSSLSEPKRMELSQRATSRAGRADDARRARLICCLKPARPGRRSERSFPATIRSSIAGANASSRRDSRGCSVVTVRGEEIHVIADNLSAHKTAQVKAFLEAHPKVHLHFTSTYSSWLNQVELWFSKIERDVIARGVFTSVPDLKRKLTRPIPEYTKHPRTVKWKYFVPKPSITPQSGVKSARGALHGHRVRNTESLCSLHGRPRQCPARI